MPKGLLFLWNTPELHTAGVGITAPLGAPAEGTPKNCTAILRVAAWAQLLLSGLSLTNTFKGFCITSKCDCAVLSYCSAQKHSISQILFLHLHVVDKSLYGCVGALCILLLQPG